MNTHVLSFRGKEVIDWEPYPQGRNLFFVARTFLCGNKPVCSCEGAKSNFVIPKEHSNWLGTVPAG